MEKTALVPPQKADGAEAQTMTCTAQIEKIEGPDRLLQYSPIDRSDYLASR